MNAHDKHGVASTSSVSCLIAVLLLCLAAGLQPAHAQSDEYLYQGTIHIPVQAAPGKGMVVCQNRVACDIGAKVLRAGGNAVDAAIATAFALAVTLPRAGNIGGGGFMLVYLKKQHRVVTIDYRSMAPAGTKLSDYLNADNKMNGKEERGYIASGIPGTVAGLWLAHEKYGRLPWAELVQPAAKLAAHGIILSQGQALSLNWAKLHHRFVPGSAARKVFERSDGRPWRAGDRLVQPDLAWSLRQIRDHGAKTFYSGAIARRLARGMAKNGGLMKRSDLKAYRAVLGQPVKGTYGGYSVVTMSPPSGGGSSVIEMLNILHNFNLTQYGPESAKSLHYEAEAIKLAWSDRSRYAGDPAFARIPTRGLTSRAFAASRAKLISPNRSLPAPKLMAGDPWQYESNETTQISVIDSDGNAVSNTFTLGGDFGSGVMIAGTGFMLGNLISNFSIRDQAAALRNHKQAIVNNLLGPGRRPVSSMSPAMLFHGNNLWMVTGSPGGNGIPGTVMQMIVDVTSFGMNIAEATNTPRINQEMRSGFLRVEPGISPDTLKLLKQWGHVIKPSRAIGCTQTLLVGSDGALYGAADPRRPGSAAVSQ